MQEDTLTVGGSEISIQETVLPQATTFTAEVQIPIHGNYEPWIVSGIAEQGGRREIALFSKRSTTEEKKIKTITSSSGESITTPLLRHMIVLDLPVIEDDETLKQGVQEIAQMLQKDGVKKTVEFWKNSIPDWFQAMLDGTSKRIRDIDDRDAVQ